MVTGVNPTRKTNISCGLGAQFSPLKDPSRTFSWVVSPSLWFLKDGWENQLLLTVFKVLCFMVFTIVPIIWPEIEKTVYTLPHFSLPRNHRFETRCTNASQNWLHGQWILQAKANGLTMGSKGKHSVQGQLASNKRAKNWPRGGGFPVPTCYKTFLCCFPRNAMAHLMWESMVSLVKYLPWWFTMGDSFYPDQTCLQFCGLVADLRACYISFKADLKTRHQMHNLQRWYKCNLFLG